MSSRLEIAIVGPGRLGNALAHALTRAGYRITEVVSRGRGPSLRKAQALARDLRARAVTLADARLDADVIWFCVSDREIVVAAQDLGGKARWQGKAAFHSSGALTSGALDPLRRRGAAVAAVHPVMTFVSGSIPSLQGVPFGVEGDAKALVRARRVVRDLGGETFAVGKDRKAAYHAWATLVCPLLVSMLQTSEQVARAAGLRAASARKYMLPIVRQTLGNYARLGPARAFSGPLIRGDAGVVRQHLKALGKIPEAREVYVALARSALRYLPVENRSQLESILKKRNAN
jgi:predicted short-subunit dehydrogenase-like oxidoreductase (DUF2520 family)